MSSPIHNRLPRVLVLFRLMDAGQVDLKTFRSFTTVKITDTVYWTIS